MYNIFIGLLTMVQLPVHSDCYSMVMKIDCRRDSGILNHEYDGEGGNTSNDESLSDTAEEDEQEMEESVEVLLLMLNAPEKKRESSDKDTLVNQKTLAPEYEGCQGGQKNHQRLF